MTSSQSNRRFAQYLKGMRWIGAWLILGLLSGMPPALAQDDANGAPPSPPEEPTEPPIAAGGPIDTSYMVQDLDALAAGQRYPAYLFLSGQYVRGSRARLFRVRYSDFSDFALAKQSVYGFDVDLEYFRFDPDVGNTRRGVGAAVKVQVMPGFPKAVTRRKLIEALQGPQIAFVAARRRLHGDGAQTHVGVRASQLFTRWTPTLAVERVRRSPAAQSAWRVSAALTWQDRSVAGVQDPEQINPLEVRWRWMVGVA
ncbi:MAG: hypothetical protein RMK49_21370, partial [Abditibacteriales bacterium]|nr:hypothetical protein [Abditibacteriales bacterium]